MPHPRLGLIPLLGVLLLIWSASVYSAFGIATFPRQEWVIESLASLVFLVPAVRILRGTRDQASLERTIRVVGFMLLLHTGWDALHWPGRSVIQTPVEPMIPSLLPFLEIPLGFLLLIRGR